MNKSKAWSLLFVFCFAGVSSCAQAPALGSVPLDAYMKRVRDFKPTEVKSLYSFVAQEFASYSRQQGAAAQCPPSSNTEQLRLIFQAAIAASFYTGETPYFERAKTCYKQLSERGSSTRSEDLAMYKAYVRHRAFDDAYVFARLHPGLDVPTLPKLKDAVVGTGPSVISIERDESTSLRVRPVRLDEMAQIVVVSSAMCKFSQAAIEDIEGDAELARVLSDALWIAPPDDFLEYDAIMRWNSLHENAQMAVAYSQKEFIKLDMSQTPVFYFMKDGKVINRLVGWRSKENLAELAAYVRDLKERE
jgi:hypothetical protein